METKQNKCSKLLIKYKVYHSETDKIDCIIMKNAVGNITNLISEIQQNKNILINILYAIVIAIKCLYDIGLYYVDIKMENILYRNTSEGIQIILGDLGGAVHIDDYSAPTYPPPEYNLDHPNLSKEYSYSKDNLVEKQSIISWGIGILTLSLLQIDHTTLYNRDSRIMIKIITADLKIDTTTDHIYNSYVKNTVDKIITLIDHNIVELIKNTLDVRKNKSIVCEYF